MKTYQFKKNLLAVGLAAAMASTTAFALDGAVGFTSVGSVSVTAIVGETAQVANLSDASFDELNPFASSQNPADISNICFYSSTGTAKIKVSSGYDNLVSDTYGAMKSGSNYIQYSASLLDVNDANGAPLSFANGGVFFNTSLTPDYGVRTLRCADQVSPAGKAGKIRLEVEPVSLAAAPAGTYTDTMTITIEPL